MLQFLLIEECGTVDKIDHSDVMKRADARLNGKLLNQRARECSRCNSADATIKAHDPLLADPTAATLGFPQACF
jgi:hypothetical protein